MKFKGIDVDVDELKDQAKDLSKGAYKVGCASLKQAGKGIGELKKRMGQYDWKNVSWDQPIPRKRASMSWLKAGVGFSLAVIGYSIYTRNWAVFRFFGNLGSSLAGKWRDMDMRETVREKLGQAAGGAESNNYRPEEAWRAT